jgi:hypothetical protein
MPDSACPKCVVVQNVSFSMSGLCHGQKCQIPHVWNVSWSKTSDLACLDLMIPNLSFSMSGMCSGQKHLQNIQNVLWWSNPLVCPWIPCMGMAFTKLLKSSGEEVEEEEVEEEEEEEEEEGK